MMYIRSLLLVDVAVTATLMFIVVSTTTHAFVPLLVSKSSISSRITPTLYTVSSSATTLDIPQEQQQQVGSGVTTSTSESLESSKQFDWNKAWYPLVPVEILDREQPHRFELLGESIVVWNDGPVTNGLFQSKKSRSKQSKRTMGTWRAFVDECPHRKVPLSEGRVEDDGTLLCSYHAWRFDGEGSCVNIPQIDPASSEYTRILNNPKSSCNSYPTKVVDGLLFVWPSSDVNAVLESELTPLPLPNSNTGSHTESNNEHNKKKSDNDIWYGAWNFRELPYGADFFLENVVDPAHVTVSHHNVVGNRYKVEPFVLKTSTKLSKHGFAMQQMTSAELPGGTTTFIAPGLVAIDVSINGAKQTLELYVSPSRPGFCNHIGRMVIVKNEKGEMPSLLRMFTIPMPTWLNHVLASAFLNQDALFLHHQERHLAQSGQYTTAVPDNGIAGNETPITYQYNQAIQAAPSDLGVITFRNWIRVLAGGRIPYRNQQTNMPPASNDIVFDVWNAHTKYCKYCQDALQRLKVIRFASYFAAATLAITRPFNHVVGTLISTFTFAGIGLLLNRLIGMFYRYEFSHAHND